jgi:S-(hydroxymethyl)glutathione dehydrogenase/alcohol dehydrogenase
MRALVFHGPGHVEVNTVADPKIEHDEDLILRVTSTAICGSDLHILNGFIPQKNELVLGHEFMGLVEEIGRGVRKLQKGDRVVVPFPIACGRCFFCGDGLPGLCEISYPENYGPESGLLDQ